MSDSERLCVYSSVAAILHLGNVRFEENPEDVRGGCRMTESSIEALKVASTLLGLDPEELHHALLSRVMQPNKGNGKGTVIMVPLKVIPSTNDSLSVNLIMFFATRLMRLAVLATLWPRRFITDFSTISFTA